MKLQYIQELINELESIDNINIIREMLLEKEEALYDLPEHFKFHNVSDDYIYQVYFDDETSYRDYIGSRAYEKFMNSSNAVKIVRYTKELKPKYELLMNKA